MTRPLARWLALGAVAAAVTINLGWVVLGLLRPEVASSWGTNGGLTGTLTSPISGLGVPPNGVPVAGTGYTLFDVVFVLTGVLLLAGVVGIGRCVRAADGRRLLGPRAVALLACCPVGIAICGVFTLHALAMHMLGYALAAATPVAGFLVAGRRLRTDARWRRVGSVLLFVASPLTLVVLVGYLSSFDMATVEASRGVAGLTSRLVVLDVTAWFAALGWLAFRRSSADGYHS
jgi:hypothetical protein